MGFSNTTEQLKKQINSDYITSALEVIEKLKKVSLSRVQYQRQYYQKSRQRLEVVEKTRKYQKEYQGRPEVKAHRRLRNKCPDVMESRRQYQREYTKRPEVAKRLKQQRDRPEVAERRKKYQKEYRELPQTKMNRKKRDQRPDVIEKRRAYRREYSKRPEVKARTRLSYHKNKETSKLKEQVC